MKLYHKYRHDFIQNLKLGSPIIIGQVGQVFVQTADNIMVGQMPNSVTALAAVALANSVYILVIVLGIGISFALPPLIAESHAMHDNKKMAADFKHSLLLNIVFAILAIIAIEMLIPAMNYWQQDPEVVKLAIPYLRISAYGIIPLMIFQTLRSYTDGQSETMPAMIAMIAANALNILLNYVLIYGNWGAPKLGVSGAAIGTFISRIIMLALLITILFFWKSIIAPLKNIHFFKYKWNSFKKLLELGIPTSLQGFFEISAFGLGSVVMAGWINKEVQAAHNIAINLASISFLICSGIAMATTIRVGNQKSLKQKQNVRNAAFSGILQVLLFMTISSVLFIVGRAFFPSLYTSNEQVISITATLLIVAALFQLPDGVQVVALGALRGLQDVFVPSIITFIAYWLLALPIGYIFTFHYNLGGVGIWLGLTIGLTCSAILMTWRFHLLSKKI